MKSLLLTLALIPGFAFSRDLKGAWTRCDTETSGYHFEHYIDFRVNNVEYEILAAYEPSPKPCTGEVAFAFGSNWHYQDLGNKFSSTLFTIHGLAMNKEAAKKFAEIKLCGTKNWQPEKRVDCSDETVMGVKLNIGMKSSYQYSVRGDELHAIGEDGETLIYTRVKEK